jgi:hypothetical protein
LWKKVRKKEILCFFDFFLRFLYKLVISIVFIVATLWSFAYYQNEISSAPMPEVTITNWKKTIIFQAMSHIWTKNFYDTIKNNIRENKEKWFVYFFEWVKPWSEENLKKFNKAIWIKFDEDLYENLAKLYWVVHQDNQVFLMLVNNLDFNVDLNLDEIMELYENDDNFYWNTNNNNLEIIDANKQVLEALNNLNEKELEILRYINKSIMNFIIKSEKIQNVLKANFTNQKLFNIILNKRNEVVSDEIIKSKYDKVYVTYWLLHFEWIFELLKINDKNWEILKTRNYFPIK